MKSIMHIMICASVYFLIACCGISCKEKKDIETLGTKAGAEMCLCYKTEEKRDECFAALETKYGKYENDKSFVSAFDKALSDCIAVSADPEAAAAGKQAGIENYECEQLKSEYYEECMEIWHNKYEKYFDNTVFLYVLKIEYNKCSK